MTTLTICVALMLLPLLVQASERNAQIEKCAMALVAHIWDGVRINYVEDVEIFGTRLAPYIHSSSPLVTHER